jgi:hypothetical protein
MGHPRVERLSGRRHGLTFIKPCNCIEAFVASALLANLLKSPKLRRV